MKTAVTVLISMLAGIIVILAISSFVTFNNNHQTARGRGDAPTGNINAEQRDVYQMPDAFSNVSMVCDKYGNAIYVTTKSDYSRGLFAVKDGCQ